LDENGEFFSILLERKTAEFAHRKFKQAILEWPADRCCASQADAIFGFRDKYQCSRNKKPGAASASHAQPFGNPPAVAR
jgi:hypothetical protein